MTVSSIPAPAEVPAPTAADTAAAIDRFLGFWDGTLTPMEAIEARHAVRSYTDEPIAGDAEAALRRAIAIVNDETNLNIQLVLDEPRAFSGFKARLVNFTGARNYLALVGPECKELDGIVGYYGEKLVLLAQSLGLNSCWVGGTYKMVNRSYNVDLGQKLTAVIALGYGTTAGVPHKSKTPDQVCPGYDDAPAWFQRGVDAALLAPTALNRQKFSFALAGTDAEGTPLVRARTKRGAFTQMDLGIAQCHFEIGAGAAPFAWADR